MLLRRAGGVWGVPNARVRTVRSTDGAYRVALEGEDEDLAADEIIGVVEDLDVVTSTSVLQRFWPEAVHGLAVYSGSPIVIVDPGRPPRLLKVEEGEG